MGSYTSVWVRLGQKANAVAADDLGLEGLL